MAHIESTERFASILTIDLFRGTPFAAAQVAAYCGGAD